MAANVQAIEALLEPSLEAMGYRLVRLNFGGAGPTLQVMAEPLDDREMTVDDCAGLSRAISALLDVEDPIAGAYELEVSSPGIDRPLVRAEDFERFKGHIAKVELARPQGGRKRFRGRLLGVDADAVLIEVADDAEGADEVVRLPVAGIAKAKLILTDELIRQALARRRNLDEGARIS